MKCPSCNSKIGFIKNLRFLVSLFSKRAEPCPYCNAIIHKQTNLVWDHFKSIFFAMFWIGVVLFLMAIIFAQQIGLKTSLLVCLWYWVVVVVVFFALIFLNLVAILIYKLYLAVNKRKNG